MKNIDQLFKTADRNILCNTAYPYRKELYQTYIAAEDLFEDTHELSFYVHIPFCRQLCSFCEYTRFPAGNEVVEERYIYLLQEQIKHFLENHTIDKVYGLDIGGGTPTSLRTEQFIHLLQISSDLEFAAAKSDDFEKSIEFSFSTIDEEKLKLISQFGFKRISAGLQTSDRRILTRAGREITENVAIKDTLEKAHDNGIEKVNLDLMYGMVGQDEESIDQTIAEIGFLTPEQVTVYETRYNLGRNVPKLITREKQYLQYSRLYDGLLSLGYKGRFGANTFSRSGDDGMSSYIRNRMRYGTPYKGFGISAQSMSRTGLSYGILKNAEKADIISIHELTEGYNYLLPKDELAAKYVSVAMYGGEFYLSVLDDILGEPAKKYYYDELSFLEQHSYADIIGGKVTLTQLGFRYYGAIAALFWSKAQKQALINYGEDKKDE